jgi:hypothetical protein
MRLWSIPFHYLDRQGLTGLWREALLAQNVLLGKTKGYKNHPQLIRFKEVYNPIAAIGQYLSMIADEADKRGYNFDRSKIVCHEVLNGKPTVTSQQLAYEFHWLSKKLEQRDVKFYEAIKKANHVPCGFFRAIDGPIENWETVK